MTVWALMMIMAMSVSIYNLLEYTLSPINFLMQNEGDTLSQKLITRSQGSKSKRSQYSQQSDSSGQSTAMNDSLGFLQQAWLLIYKNIILTFKNPKNLVFLIITPFLLSAFLYIFQQLARESGQRTRTTPQQLNFPIFPKCFGQNCISLDYRMMSNSHSDIIPKWVNYTLDYIRLESGLKQSDFSTGSNIANISDLQNYYNDQAAHPNTTQIGVIFCNGAVKDFLLNMFYCNGTNQDFTYFLVLNRSDSLSVLFHDYLQPLPIDQVASSLKVQLNQMIAANRQLNIELFQRQNNRLAHQIDSVYSHAVSDNYDIVTTIGAFYYLITPLFAFLFIQNQIVREKQYRLRQGLNIFGASHIAYWTSWFVVSNFYALVVAISTYAAGSAFGFGFFRDTPFYIIIFLLLYPFTLAMQMLAYMISAIAPTLKASNTVSYAIMLFAIVVQSFVSDNMLLTFLFSEDVSPIIQFLKIFFCFYPPFSYTKIFTNITQYSGNHFSFIERRWLNSGISYDLDIYTQNIQNVLPFGGGLYYRYSDLFSTLILFGDAIFFLLLTWYFDHVIASNRGRNEPFYFPFNRIYDKFFRERKPVLVNDLINYESNGFSLQEEQESAVRERNKVYMNSKNGFPAFGMRIKNLSKTFKKLFSSHKVQALKNFTLQIQPNELMGILGHNGAGKTTLINILTGVINPDDFAGSQIIIDNHPISDINEIRKHIGVCAQFDILWDQLTAEDHLYMFARLKGIAREETDAKINQILDFVSLLPQKTHKVGSFSGGMKRRLSLAIAAIGNPKIILLDEPTSGLDPKVRQQVWHLIERLKQGKSIILTTHSMQQADVLADRICVVVKGKMKCVGSTFYLKKTYGQGHRLTINLCKREDQDEVVARIQKMFPAVKLVDCRGGSLILGINDYQDLLHLVKKLQSKESLGLDQYELKKSIKAWAVSHSTLEQVFMKVSKQKQQ